MTYQTYPQRGEQNVKIGGLGKIGKSGKIGGLGGLGKVLQN